VELGATSRAVGRITRAQRASKAGGREVSEHDRHILLDDFTASGVRYEGIDGGGHHFVTTTTWHRLGQSPALRETTLLRISAAGAMSVVATGDRRLVVGLGFIGGQWDPDRVYFTPEGDTPPDAATRPWLPNNAGVFCIDREGRIYARGGRSNLVQLIWPKHEQPGDVLRAQRSPELGLGQSFADTAGRIWRKERGVAVGWRPEGAVLTRWDGKAWRLTPVRRAKHPRWMARALPPWRKFDRPLHVQVGRDGTLLAVAVADIWQGSEPKRGWNQRWEKIEQLGKKALSEGRSLHWLEGWLYKDGGWSGPTKMEDLVAEHRQTLLLHFTRPTPETAHIDLQSDGKWLWVAYDGVVRAIDADGHTLAWDIPEDHRHGARRRFGPVLQPVNVICLPGGAVWCAYAAGDGYRVVALRVAEDHLDATPVLPLGGEGDVWPWWFATSDGRVWLCRNERTHVWRDGRLEEKPALGKPVLWEDNGQLWFLPRDLYGPERGYHIVQEGETHTLAWPFEFEMGAVCPTGKNRYLAACGDTVVAIDATGDDPGRWRVSRVHLLAGVRESRGVFLDGHGNLVGVAGWSASFSP
jgi:hypothetical protein